MNHKDLVAEFDRTLVYIKEIDVALLPEDVRAASGGASSMYAVHGADGERLALVPNRRIAHYLALENELIPVTVH